MVLLSRRQFLQRTLHLTSFSLLAGCESLPFQGRQRPKVPRIGLVNPNTADSPVVKGNLAGLRQGLAELGYVEGQNLILELRFAEGRQERIPELTAELVGLPVDILLAAAQTAIAAARDATSSIPIVMAGGADPVGNGFVASLARPGGNITGIMLTPPDFGAKLLELLKEISPAVARVGVLWNAGSVVGARDLTQIQAAGQTLRVDVQSLEVRGASDFAGAFEAAKRDRADALLVTIDPLMVPQFAAIADFARLNRLPSIHGFRDFAAAGGLLSYGSNFPDIYRRSAAYVDKILKGRKPADPPVEQPERFDLVLNKRTAETLALTLPQSILMQVTEVIQ